MDVGRKTEEGGRRGKRRREGVEAYRTSQVRPSVAVCFFAASSCSTSDWRSDESPGATSWRSRTFCERSVGGAGLVLGGRAHLDIGQHVGLDGCKGHGAEDIWRSSAVMQAMVGGDVPNKVHRDSEASRKGLVSMALLESLLMGTSTKDRFSDPKNFCSVGAMLSTSTLMKGGARRSC